MSSKNAASAIAGLLASLSWYAVAHSAVVLQHEYAQTAAGDPVTDGQLANSGAPFSSGELFDDSGFEPDVSICAGDTECEDQLRQIVIDQNKGQFNTWDNNPGPDKVLTYGLEGGTLPDPVFQNNGASVPFTAAEIPGWDGAGIRAQGTTFVRYFDNPALQSAGPFTLFARINPQPGGNLTNNGPNNRQTVFGSGTSSGWDLYLDDSPGAVAADYSGDGANNAADYTVYRDTLGSTEDLRADGDGSETIDQPDYNVWKDNFGAAGGIPEGFDGTINTQFGRQVVNPGTSEEQENGIPLAQRTPYKYGEWIDIAVVFKGDCDDNSDPFSCSSSLGIVDGSNDESTETVEIYVNGQLTGTVTGAASFNTNSGGISISMIGDSFGNQPLNAYVDRMIYWNEALDPSLIAALSPTFPRGSAASVPEPTSLLMFAVGLATFGRRNPRRRRG